MATVSGESASPALDGTSKDRGLIDYLIIAAKGFCMGSADVVPGVSGGTMAFILGIYEELLNTIRNVGQPPFIQAVLGFRIQEALKILNWKFLVAIFGGIVLAVVTLAPMLEWLLEEHEVLLWSFFFGLVVASAIAVSRRVSQWTPPLWIMLVIGTVFAFWLVGMTPAQTPETWWFLMLSGAIAICAMILPGISGSFILVLMSKYQFFIEAVTSRDFVSIGLAGVGALVGLVSFAQLLSWLFKRYHDLTVALLTGLMIGSLRKVWPWKEVLETTIDRHGDEIPLIEANILPSVGIELVYAVGLAILGFAAVMLIERLGGTSETTHG